MFESETDAIYNPCDVAFCQADAFFDGAWAIIIREAANILGESGDNNVCCQRGYAKLIGKCGSGVSCGIWSTAFGLFRATI